MCHTAGIPLSIAPNVILVFWSVEAALSQGAVQKTQSVVNVLLRAVPRRTPRRHERFLRPVRLHQFRKCPGVCYLGTPGMSRSPQWVSLFFFSLRNFSLPLYL